MDFSSACDGVDSDNRGFADRVCMLACCHISFTVTSARTERPLGQHRLGRERAPLRKSNSGVALPPAVGEARLKLVSMFIVKFF